MVAVRALYRQRHELVGLNVQQFTYPGHRWDVGQMRASLPSPVRVLFDLEHVGKLPSKAVSRVLACSLEPFG